MKTKNLKKIQFSRKNLFTNLEEKNQQKNRKILKYILFFPFLDRSIFLEKLRKKTEPRSKQNFTADRMRALSAPEKHSNQLKNKNTNSVKTIFVAR